MDDVLDLAAVPNLAQDEGVWLFGVDHTGYVSSNVYMVRYEPGASGAGELGVWFWRPDGVGGKEPGPQYFYPGITRHVYDDLLAAPSWGRWVWHNLRQTHWPFRGPFYV